MTGEETSYGYEHFVVIYEDTRGDVVVSLGLGPRDFYDGGLETSEIISKQVIFSRYGVSSDQIGMVDEQLEAINLRPLSEVSEQVDDLVSKLKGGNTIKCS